MKQLLILSLLLSLLTISYSHADSRSEVDIIQDLKVKLDDQKYSALVLQIVTIENPSDDLIEAICQKVATNLKAGKATPQKLTLYLQKNGRRVARILTKDNKISKFEKKILLTLKDKAVASMVKIAKTSRSDSFNMIKLLVNYNPKLRDVKECGVKNYISKEHPSCGPKTFVRKQSPNCPPSLFRMGTGGPCGTRVVRVAGRRVCRERCGGERAVCSVIVCHTPYTNQRVANRCRHRAFGVERYSVCEHPNHGPATYKVCSKKVFGVKTHKKCKIIKTVDELGRYLDNLNTNLPFLAQSLISHKVSMIRNDRSPKVLACLIKKWDQEKNTSSAVEELKSQFLIITGEDYEDYKDTDCLRVSMTGADVKCASRDKRRYCKSKRAYEATVALLEKTSRELAKLAVDKVAREKRDFLDRILEQNDKVIEIMKLIE